MRKKKLNSNLNLVLITNLIISVFVLIFAFSLSGSIVQKDVNKTSLFLGITLFFVVLYNVFAFIRSKNKKERFRLTIISLAYIAACVMGFVARFYYIFFYLSSFTFILFLGINQILKTFLCEIKPSIPRKVTLYLLGITLIVLSTPLIADFKEEIACMVPLIVTISALIIAMANLIAPSLNFDKMRLFVSIILKTHLFDILVCLLALMIAFSFLFPMVDSNIPSFWDAMWYCFAIVTTIGFGDYYSTTLFGRLLSVVLGIYGIIVVAIITSVIVSFYNALSSQEKEIKNEIKKEQNR